jgi:hypothetical protein
VEELLTRADWIAIAALFLSIVSIVTTIYFNLRDRAKLDAKSTFYPAWNGVGASMTVSIVNKGRRPAVLHMWGGTGSDNDWAGTLLDSKAGGLRLVEQARHELRLTSRDLVEETPEGEIVFTDLWFEDTLGRRHIVSNAKKHISLLRQDGESDGKNSLASRLHN